MNDTLEWHKHVTDVKLDLTVMYLDRIPLLWGLFSEESIIIQLYQHDQTNACVPILFTDRTV